MEQLDSVNYLYSLSGLLVGVLIGMTGVGGGSLMTPLLILFFGVHPETAVGTDLLYASATKTAGTGVHSVSRSVDWQIVSFLAAGSIPATILAIYGLTLLGPTSQETSALITGVLGGALFLTAASLLFRGAILRAYADRIGELGAERTRLATTATGFVLGVLVAISSVGAGALGVTALLLLYPRLPMVRIVGSDIAHAVPLTFIAGIGHWFIGSLDWLLLASLLIGSIPGIIIGSFLANRVSEAILRTLLSVILAGVATRLVFA
jgi:uncharacterized membrane protein YfcA